MCYTEFGREVPEYIACVNLEDEPPQLLPSWVLMWVKIQDGETSPLLPPLWRQQHDHGAMPRACSSHDSCSPSETLKLEGTAKGNMVAALRRNDSKHRGIYVQIFKHSWKDAPARNPFLCSLRRNEFNTWPDANAKWRELFLASIAKLPLFVKRFEFSCGCSSWLYSVNICNPPPCF